MKKETIIDAVIYWVDGNDKKWQQKYNEHIGENERKIDFEGRYISSGEVNYVVNSILKYAPFVRKIFLVTDNQRPEGFQNLVEASKKKGIELLLIDHKVIFKGYEKYLPTFNSTSIETMLYRIPTLSEYFLIFNDDVFLIRKTRVEDFFVEGKPVIRGKWQKFYEDRFFRKLYLKSLQIFGFLSENKSKGFKLYLQNSAKLVGCKKYLRRFHTPIVMKKSVLEDFFVKNPELLENNIKYKFRHEEQFVVTSLFEHLSIKKGEYIKKSIDLIYFGSYKNYLLMKIKVLWFYLNGNIKFLCLQNINKADRKTFNFLINWLDKLTTNK